MNSKQVLETVVRMLSAETGCEPDHLSDGGVHIVARIPERRSLPDHRGFDPHPGRIAAVTLGTGAVISVDATDLEWAVQTFSGISRDELFRVEYLSGLVRRSKPDNLTIFGPFPRFAAPLSAIPEPEHSPGYSVRVVDIEASLAREQTMIDRRLFPNALFPEPDISGRPTVFAAISERGGRIVGVAGVSKDSAFMYQIGIDVLPGHRGNGLAPAMTAAVSRAVFEAGAMPYYGTSSSNVPSMRTALAAGLRPMWIEVLTRPA